MKKLISSAIALTLIGGLLGCSSGKDGAAPAAAKKEPEAKKETVTLKFAVQHSAPIVKKYEEEWIPMFQKEHPNIKIEMTPDPDKIAYFQRMKTQFATKKNPDIIRMTIEEFPNFVQSGALLSIQDYVKKDSAEIKLDDFAPNLLKAFSAKDQLYILPTDWNSTVIHYNKKIFDEMKVPYPKDGWTWDDFLETAKKLTVDKNGDGKIDQYGFLVTDRLFSAAPFIYGAGGKFMTDDFSKALINSPEGKEALQYYVDLVQKHKVAMRLPGANPANMFDAFVSGQAAMVSLPRGSIVNILGKMEFDIAHNPKGPKGIGGVFGIGGYAIMSNTKHPDEAWTFMKWLASKEQQARMTEIGGSVPGRLSVANSDAILKYPEHAKIYYDETKYVTLLETPPAFSEIEATFNSELGLMFEGKKTVDNGLSYIEGKFNEILKKK
ncbi:ABC transporter substrate-binding protein [Paenibacillus piri]|uniref:Sugar ABC transporter substrate-binding protein n=1 Tax=Paenibacillus piri TaxID=2547395 RepID=A0A4R5KUN4_9BACL|nr:sugar ABC transporter substrate-binding protein [Paenibacillus piri]TDF98775.1 sugar ABC transporter substrate-binding protein [Paenibacillus piri]